ncbi:hypothetical protein VAPA_1c02570 [Variovorax paradoxus B4]|uniref:Uncharacterized protein n=1 Tax=Variovorax paradoxus B4 TaxID=1246301 RepID=T1X395_VARPD|nr:hypothetical protein [Variovorax paradoxus]AGU47387.1 hypothetical protein VAPA_1c02570 [Variovorax paradoxus B4]
MIDLEMSSARAPTQDVGEIPSAILPPDLRQAGLRFVAYIDTVLSTWPEECLNCGANRFKLMSPEHSVWGLGRFRCLNCRHMRSRLTGSPLMQLKSPDLWSSAASLWLHGWNAGDISKRFGLSNNCLLLDWLPRFSEVMAEREPALWHWWHAYHDLLEPSLPVHIAAPADEALAALRRMLTQPVERCVACGSIKGRRRISNRTPTQGCVFECGVCGHSTRSVAGTPFDGLKSRHLLPDFLTLRLQGGTHSDCMRQLGITVQSLSANWEPAMLRWLGQRWPVLPQWIAWRTQCRRSQVVRQVRANTHPRQPFIAQSNAATAHQGTPVTWPKYEV